VEVKMKIHVSYDENGRILAAGESGGDAPAHMPGATIGHLDVPGEYEKLPITEFVHLLRVDPQHRKLVKG